MPHKDPDVRQEYHRAYKRENRWRYQSRQKVYDAAKHANARAARLGSPGKVTPEQAEKVLRRGRCAWCGKRLKFEDATIDHVIALGQPKATNTLRNLCCSCDPCNKSKGRRDRPGRWSRNADRCRVCGSAERPHRALGCCSPCYQAERKAAK